MAKHLCAVLGAFALAACSHTPTNEELGTAGGAAIGGVVGNQIGRRHDNR